MYYLLATTAEVLSQRSDSRITAALSLAEAMHPYQFELVR